MQSFRGILSERDIAAVAMFVETEFVRCRSPNTRYHTAENGWPDHRDRYGKAFPFVLGDASADAPWASLDPDQQQGLLLFRQSCVTCHLATPVSDLDVRHDPPSAHEEHEEHEKYEEYEEYEEYGGHDSHDEEPLVTGLAPAEARGRTLYRENCAYCHAADGTGRNAIGRFLEPHPPDLTSPRWSALAHDALARAILDGKPGSSMPAFRTVLAEADAAAISAYIRRAFVEQQ